MPKGGTAMEIIGIILVMALVAAGIFALRRNRGPKTSEGPPEPIGLQMKPKVYGEDRIGPTPAKGQPTKPVRPTPTRQAESRGPTANAAAARSPDLTRVATQRLRQSSEDEATPRIDQLDGSGGFALITETNVYPFCDQDSGHRLIHEHLVKNGLPVPAEVWRMLEKVPRHAENRNNNQ